jgi:hypothetical protein
MIVSSVSMDLDNKVAVQYVVKPQISKTKIPYTQPAFIIPTGNANNPTPINTLTELNIVCGAVDCPAKTVTTFPSSSSTFLTWKIDGVVAAEIDDLKLENDGAAYNLGLNCELLEPPYAEFCRDLDSFNALTTSS